MPFSNKAPFAPKRKDRKSLDIIPAGVVLINFCPARVLMVKILNKEIINRRYMFFII